MKALNVSGSLCFAEVL